MTVRRVILTPTGTHDPNTGNTMDIGSSSQSTFSGVVRSIRDNKAKLLSCVCDDFTVTVPSKPSEHPSVTEGFGYWYSCDLTNYNTSAVISRIYVTDGRIPNNYTASAYRATKDYIPFKTNIFTLMFDDTIEYSLDINTQQYHNDSYTDSAHVPFYDCDKNRDTLPYTDITYNLIVPTVNATLQSDGNVVDNPLTVTWTTNIQDFYKIVVNGKIETSGTNPNTRSYRLSQRNLVLGENIVTVTCENRTRIYDGEMEYAEGTKTVKINLGTAIPTLSNISLQNDNMLIDNPTTVRWKSTWQNIVNFYLDGVLKHSITGSLAQECILPKGFFHVGSNALKVEVVKNQVYDIANTEKRVDNTSTHSFTRLTPTVTNLKLTGTNRDYNSTFTFDTTLCDYYTVYIDGTQYVKGNPPTGGKCSVNISQGVLILGSNSIRVVATLNSFEVVEAEAIIDVTVTQDSPLIYSIEPNNIDVNVDMPITISFNTNEFCDSWELTSGVNSWSGTTGRSINVSKSTFTRDTVTMTLVTKYTPSWSTIEVREATKTVSFVGYGIPNLPAHDAKVVYNTAAPTFTWTDGTSLSDEQVACEIKVLNGTAVVESAIVNTAVQSYTVKTPLINKTEYKVQVSIKNKYELWSNFSEKVFTTSFNDLPVPTVELTANKYDISISINSFQPATFKEIKLYRRVDDTDWIIIADNLNAVDLVSDYMCSPNVLNYYKCRLYDTAGGYSESDVKSVMFRMMNYHIENVEDRKSEIQLDFVTVSFKKNYNVEFKMFAGATKPVGYADNMDFVSGTITADVTRAELKMIEKIIRSDKIYCYRDWRGRKVYCNIIISTIDYAKGMDNNSVTLELTEVNFKEGYVYRGGGFVKLVYLDGSYLLDGIIDMSGYDPNFVRKVVRTRC